MGEHRAEFLAFLGDLFARPCYRPQLLYPRLVHKLDLRDHSSKAIARASIVGHRRLLPDHRSLGSDLGFE
jgi:hypothetical protein